MSGEIFGYTYGEFALYALAAWVILSILGGLMLYATNRGNESLVKECLVAAGYILIAIVYIAVSLAALAFSLIAGIIVVVVGLLIIAVIATDGDLLDIFDW